MTPTFAVPAYSKHELSEARKPKRKSFKYGNNGKNYTEFLCTTEEQSKIFMLLKKSKKEKYKPRVSFSVEDSFKRDEQIKIISKRYKL